MDGKTLARIGAVAFVAIAITVAVINLSDRNETSQSTLTPVIKPIGAPDPLQAELTRCNDMGEAATRDPTCLSTWAENRRRFLGEFPSRFYLTSRCVVWDLAEVEAWLDARKRASKAKTLKLAPSPDVQLRKARPVKRQVRA